MSLRLVLFDVDGTLTDSQAVITNAMIHAFEATGRAAPSRPEMLSVVGLSLRNVALGLMPDASPDEIDTWCEAYKTAFHQGGNGHAASPLFAGMSEVLEELAGQESTLVGLATGKGRRGLDGMIAAQALGPLLVTTQCADEHPSKPHPSMVLTAMTETGVTANRCVVIGDTRFDLEMAHAAGVKFIAVTWGYHSAALLDGADAIVHHPHDIPKAIDTILR